MNWMRISTAFLFLGVLLSGSPLAFGHVTKGVGIYAVKVGWASEPALVRSLNAVEIFVKNNRTGAAVEDVHKTIKASLSLGGKTLQLELEEDHNVPGRFFAHVILTRPGTYTVSVSGTIEGTPINLSFEIEKVSDLALLQFPEPDPDPVALQKTLSDVQKATGLIPNLQRALTDLQGKTAPVAELQRSLSELRQSAQSASTAAASAQRAGETASTLAFAGIGLGIVGIILAAIALTKRGKVAKA